MRPDARFLGQPKSFWAHVRTLSQAIGYTERRKKAIRVPTIDRIVETLRVLELTTEHIVDSGTPTSFANLLVDYFTHRAEVLNTFVEPRLMDAEEARELFENVRERCRAPEKILPLNKQKGEKKAHAYLTGLVNMLIYEHGVETCDYDPRLLTTVTRDEKPLRTLARRIDGAFPTLVNPISIWEIKEYYFPPEENFINVSHVKHVDNPA